MNNTLISVIVPVYNVEPYLEMCIESIIHQQYTNLEIILVDDGSTDHSGAICDNYAELDKRIHVIHKPNGGLSDARNVGIQYAHGNLLGFVDSDDWIDPNMYLELHDAIVQNNCEIAVCNWTIVKGNLYSYDEGDGAVHLLNQQDALELLLDDIKCKSYAWNKLYKKEAFNGISFPRDKYYENFYIMHLVFENAQSIALIEKPLYYYRQKDDSILHIEDMKVYLAGMEAIRERYFHYRDNEVFSLSVAKHMLNFQTDLLTFQDSWKMDRKERKDSLAAIKRYYAECCREKLPWLPIQTRLKRLLLTFPLFAPFICKLLQTTYGVSLRRFMFDWIDQKHSPNSQNTMEILRQSNHKRRVILMGSPEYRNLGDLAIGYSIQNYIREHFSELDFYEIPEKSVIYNFRKIKSFIRRDDVLLLIGGGNFGDLYSNIYTQRIRLSVLKNFPHNKIVQFPQTWVFTKTKKGNSELKKTQKILKKCKSCTLFAREIFSYELFREYFQNTDIRMVPDIVLSNASRINPNKEGILICLRGDIESRLDVQARFEITNTCMQYGHVECWDTCTINMTTLDRRDQAVLSGIDYVGRHKLMVTDRFHGIIFAAITGTPCIAISNNNQKVKGLIKLLDMRSIRLMTDIQQLPDLISAILREYPNGSQEQLSKLDFDPLYECLASVCRERKE